MYKTVQIVGILGLTFALTIGLHAIATAADTSSPASFAVMTSPDEAAIPLPGEVVFARDWDKDRGRDWNWDRDRDRDRNWNWDRDRDRNWNWDRGHDRDWDRDRGWNWGLRPWYYDRWGWRDSDNWWRYRYYDPRSGGGVYFYGPDWGFGFRF